MARLHTKKRGKSASRKPLNKPIAWETMSREECEKLAVKMAREGKTEAQIGNILRDQHAIPSVKLLTGKRLSEVLKEAKALPKYPNDLLDLIKKAVAMQRHLKGNAKDLQNRQKLSHIESKIKRLARYYRGRKLPVKWAYSSEQAELMVK